MLRLLRNVTVILVLLLFVGGVLEVRVHPERLADLPQRVLAPILDKDSRAAWMAWLIQTRRDIEQRFVRDDARRLELATLTVETDASELEELLSGAGDQAMAEERVALLAASLEHLASVAGEVPLDTLFEHHEKVRDAYTLASEIQQRLSEEDEERDALLERAAGSLTTLREHMKSFNAVSEDGE